MELRLCPTLGHETRAQEAKMKKSIYPQRSQDVNRIFENEDHRKILVVPIDFAKEIHEAQICRGTGEYLLKNPIRVYNSALGLDYLETRIQKSCRKYGIDKSSVVVCGEDPPSFTTNFIHGLKQRGLLFVRVNAKEASKLRESTRASTNALDLNGIAQAAIHRRGYDPADYTDVYAALKQVTRARRRVTRQMTRTKNQIHTQVDVLFPGFLSKRRSALEPFCDACLALMEDSFSARRIQRMRTSKLEKILKQNRTRNPQAMAASLKEQSTQVVQGPPELALTMSNTLAAFVQLVRQQQKSIDQLEESCAQLLAQTPCFILLTIPGVGVIMAAEIAAELGDPANWLEAKRIASYAGICTRIKNTGHPDKEPAVLSLPRDCNRRLRNAFMWIAEHLIRYQHPVRRESLCHDGSHPLQKYAIRKEAVNGTYILGTAKKLVRTMCAMVHRQVPYMGACARPANLDDAFEVMQVEMTNAIEVINYNYRNVDLNAVDNKRNLMQKWIDKTTEDFQLTAE
jgi:transposase